jgi:RNA polymerase sigma factor (sigma-70 family)
MKTLFADDRELLAAFREGRRDALEHVYRTYVRAVDRRLRALARSSGHHATIAQPSVIADLLQDIFVRAFSPRARNGYDGLRDYGPYLMTIARNCFYDLLRSSGRELATQPTELALVVGAADPEPDHWCDRRLPAVLGAYIGALPPPLRRIYEQRFVLGLSQIETSSALGLSRRAVRTGEDRLRRGLRKTLVQSGISLRELHQPDVESSTRIPAPAVSARRG